MEFVRSVEGATEEEVAAAEAHFGVIFPQSYKNFLLASNGGWPTDAYSSYMAKRDEELLVDLFFSVTEYEHGPGTIQEALADHDDIPPGLLPFAESLEGDLFCLALGHGDDGCVVYWVHDRSPVFGYDQYKYHDTYRICGSFSHFLSCLGKMDLDYCE
jgi:cell wall assembly regulator SMI1